MTGSNPSLSDLDITRYQAPAHLLEGRIIAVTGAGDGIGREAALTFARHGATVILIGRTIGKLESVYDAIEDAGGAQPGIYPMCLEGASENDYAEMHDRLDQEFGRLDGLLLNASVLGERRPIAQYPLDTWNQVMQVNVTSQFLMTKALLPLLDKSDQASVVFTSSAVGRKGRAFWGAYAVSKFATEGLMQILAAELSDATDIRVNAINPGATRTAMRASAYPAEDPATLKTPAEIMPAYLYFMGSESIGVTGRSVDAQP